MAGSKASDFRDSSAQASREASSGRGLGGSAESRPLLQGGPACDCSAAAGLQASGRVMRPSSWGTEQLEGRRTPAWRYYKGRLSAAAPHRPNVYLVPACHEVSALARRPCFKGRRRKISSTWIQSHDWISDC